jgi:phenylpropionate dioxygenase-like ring-hydroxylating dioxygenase large terminal subunit/NADPH-dependent 2,4-dienoyl-CoA reductase/sulfur reductase-like enzyme
MMYTLYLTRVMLAMGWQKVAEVSSVPEAGVVGVDVGGVAIALYRLAGQIFATHGICTHALAILADGWVEDGKIECPLHQGLFDIRTGKALCAPLVQDLRTYAVKVENNSVFVDLDLPAESDARAKGAASSRPADDTAKLRAVIVGAGQSAAAAIRSMRAAGYCGTIDLVGDEVHLPYERPPLSKAFLTGGGNLDSCLRLDQESVAELDVKLHLGVSVVAVDPAARTVTLQDALVLPYDALLLATGGRATRLKIPGADLPNVFCLRTPEDARAIDSALTTARHVAVIGGGFIGLELASAAASRGVAVTLIERESELMTRLLPPVLGRMFRALAMAHGIDVRTDTAVSEIMSRGGGLGVVAGAELIQVDAVLAGVGMLPNVALADLAGCALDGGVVVDVCGQTSVQGIWAAGDCATYHRPVKGVRVRLESWQNAEEQGAAAGRSMAAANLPPTEKLPWFWSDQFGLNLQMLGLIGRSDRIAFAGVDPARIEAGDVFYAVDRDTMKLTGVLAVSAPHSIQAARALLNEQAVFDPAQFAARFVDESDFSSPRQSQELAMNQSVPLAVTKRFVWPAEGLSRIPDWVYTDQDIYDREVAKIFHGKTWNFVALECEVPNTGDFIRSNVGPTPVIVSRAEDGTVHVFENRCSHRAAEFCRELSGNVGEFVCPYHQWSYDLKGNLAGVPFRRGAGGKGGMPKDFKTSDHGPTRLRVASHRGVVFASYSEDVEPLDAYLGEEVLREFEATFDGRKLKLLGYYRHTLLGNWKLYHENLRDPYHATLLHTFLVTFGLLVAGNKFMMLMDPTGRHGVMGSAKSDTKNVANADKKEMRAFKEDMKLEEPRFMDFIPEFDSPWSVTMSTIWPNLIVQREMNTLGIRHIVPNGPNEFIMKWTMFGFEGDDDEMTRHRLRQGNLMGPAGFLGIEDNEAIKFVQDGMRGVPDKEHLVMLDPDVPAGSTDSIISEAAIRAMYQHWRSEMGL